MKFTLGTLLLLLTAAAAGQKNLTLDDKTYEPQIRTVLCYSLRAPGLSMMPPAVAGLDNQDLMLEFDDLQDNRQNYYARLVHCNFDWTKSTLMDLDFIQDYNEFPVNDYSPSINQQTAYIHYRFAIPAVKLPGNYVLMVYRDGNRNDLILTQRIMLVDPRIDLSSDQDLSGLGNMRSTNQALNFTINYSRTEVINPASSIHVTIRQNQRWDNAKQDVRPSSVREDINQLEYHFFDLDKTFKAGNEFRFVDFRSLNYPGQNTGRLQKDTKPYTLWVALDAPRGNQAYALYNDMNGSFLIDNKDYGQEPWVSANYLAVNFTLKSERLKGNLYVMGAFNRWQKNDENKMAYRDGVYSCSVLLKQGFYNYQYWLEDSSDDGNHVEGNYFQTENFYEVFVYYRPFQPNADLLIGYYVVNVNPH